MTHESSAASDRALSFAGRWSGLAIVLVAFTCVVATGIHGIDFGLHWDEHLSLQVVNRTIRSGIPLPGLYDWPAVTYLLSVGSVFPDILLRFKSDAYLTEDDFILQARTVFLVVSSLGGPWLYLALRGRAGELGAGFGGATYLLSFQFAYHARWIAPDALLASATALFVLLLVIAWDSPESRFRTCLPAVGAAVAAATKYQGAVLLLPVWVMFVARWCANPPSLARQVKAFLSSAVVFAVTWLVLNPGAVLQTNKFVSDVRAIRKIYQSGHLGFQGSTPSYDIVEPVSYLSHLAQYVVVSLPSHYRVLSIAVALLAAVGVVTLARRERWFAAALLAPCAVLPLYFARMPVFIVRNFLLLLPFLAFFAGVGVGRLRELARARVWTFALTSAVVGIILVNALWLVHAAATVTQGMDQTVRDAAAYMTHHRETDFAVSTRLAQTFDAAEVRLPDNARVGGEGDETLMLLSDLRYNPTARVRRWPSTERGSFHTIGPLEVDFDFYSTWAGQDRVMVFTAERLRDYGVTVE